MLLHLDAAPDWAFPSCLAGCGEPWLLGLQHGPPLEALALSIPQPSGVLSLGVHCLVILSVSRGTNQVDMVGEGKSPLLRWDFLVWPLVARPPHLAGEQAAGGREKLQRGPGRPYGVMDMFTTLILRTVS